LCYTLAMKLIADLHIHSHYSRATSKDLTFEHLTRWAQMKGVHIVATGDFTHPGWLQEMQDKLEPAEEGLFQLKRELASAVQRQVPPACGGLVRFLLAGEISNIYKKDGKTRKVHNLVYAPSFEAAARLQARLEKIGNIRADGRPILGLDARDLLQIVLETDPACYLVPAHIWTPWFSLLGSKSGFDSVEECFGDLTLYIFALETGLSSDPPMNWRVSALDRYTLVSNSDAHSPDKLAREANLFDTELAYPALFAALRSRDPRTFLGTIEFFPEEGKYHFDGHRGCGIRWDPLTTMAHNSICPKCGKEVTIGVMHRVERLADRPPGVRPAGAAPFHSLIPLPELLAEVYGVGAGTRQVEVEYLKLLGRLGPELTILRDIPLEEIAAAGGERLAEGIGRMRRGEIEAEAGYDGEYGLIRVFGRASAAAEGQLGLFAAEGEGRGQGSVPKGEEWAGTHEQPVLYGLAIDQPAVEETAAAEQGADQEAMSQALRLPDQYSEAAGEPAWHPGLPAVADRISYGADAASRLLADLNPEQRAAVLCVDAPLIIVAGPGTGKTRTLTARIAYLIAQQGVAPESVLAITFTNKAAGEMRERLEGLLGPEVASRVTIKTFHAFGALLLREHAAQLGLDPDFVILADDERVGLLQEACPELKPGEVETTLEQISAMKNRWLGREGTAVLSDPGHSLSIYHRYEAALRAARAVDFDDLILLPIRLFEEHPEVLARVRARYRWISVDEYQDINAAQYRLLRLLTSPEYPVSLPSGLDARQAEGLASGSAATRMAQTVPNLCVIGDPDQAIYGFRGADRRFFLRFAEDYPGAMRLTLSRNYRSTQLILDAAQQVISRSPSHQALQLFSDFADQIKLDVQHVATDRAEAEYVVHQIEQMVGGTSYFSLDSGRASGQTPAAAYTFADFAVLYRLAAQSRLLIEAFERSGIPYQTVGPAPLTAHRAVREVLAYLWLLHNPRSRAHLALVLMGGQGLDQVLKELEAVPGCSLALALERVAGRAGLSDAQRRRLAGLAAFWRQLDQARASVPIAELIQLVAQFISARDADIALLSQLSRRAAPYGSRLDEFLEAMALQSETDVYDPRADRVALMTLHAAKGLEFPVVFIVGCEEGLLPYIRQGETPDVEEERRLFYVGMTRARQRLILTHARVRFLFGREMRNPLSRFVEDIEAALKEVQEIRHARQRKAQEGRQLSLF